MAKGLIWQRKEPEHQTNISVQGSDSLLFSYSTTCSPFVELQFSLNSSHSRQLNLCSESLNQSGPSYKPINSSRSILLSPPAYAWVSRLKLCTDLSFISYVLLAPAIPPLWFHTLIIAGTVLAIKLILIILLHTALTSLALCSKYYSQQ